MNFPRAGGLLLHPTSLPGSFGMGDFGPSAYRFIDFLSAAGQKIWQVLPLVATGYGESPYASLSSYAGNALLISPEKLVEHGYLDQKAIANPPAFSGEYCDFGAAGSYRRDLLRKAFGGFSPTTEVRAFEEQAGPWLEKWAEFMALKQANGDVSWTDWKTLKADPKEIAFQKFCQFEFYRQWNELKTYCNQLGIRILGDIPIYVAHDSADVWANQEYFELDKAGRPLHVAGVPPDYFSATGQLWGNPIYRWDRLEADGYGWWIERFRRTLETVDVIRVDHFRGFEAYWSVPAHETTAIPGKWIKGPGSKLFQAVQAALGEVPIIAENLGVITPEVEAIRFEFGFPGMCVLQFAFGNDPQASSFLPHNFPRSVVAYTGTHDNDTTVGWWNSKPGTDSTRTAAEVAQERAFAKAYLHSDGHAIQWDFIRTILASVADTALIPLQDVLGLGSEARMNLPATATGNWSWRFREEKLLPEYAERLRQLVELYDR